MNAMIINGLKMAGFFAVTTLILVYSMCGIVSNMVVSILFGLFELAICGYFCYAPWKKSDQFKVRILYGFVALTTLVSAITNFSIHKYYFTDYGNASRWMIVFCISLGLSSSASIAFTSFTEKFMGEVISQNGIDEFMEQIIYLVLSTAIQVLQAFLMCSIGNRTEAEMVHVICIRSIGTVFCGLLVGLTFGVYLGSKAEPTNLGYVQPDE